MGLMSSLGLDVTLKSRACNGMRDRPEAKECRWPLGTATVKEIVSPVISRNTALPP